MTSIRLKNVLEQALNELITNILAEPKLTRSKLESQKRTIAKRYELKRFVKNSEILEFIRRLDYLSDQEKDYLSGFLQTRRVRTISGIAVVAVMTKPLPCPGKCIYCPDVEGAPKSYTGREPAAMRGTQNDFIPKKQVEARLLQLKSIGHQLDKIHLVIMGGTFLAAPPTYHEYFVKECLDGITGKSSNSLIEAHSYADASLFRNVGITFETRPDYCLEQHVRRVLELGGTWIEIGLQTLSNEILKLVQRHHTLDDVRKAIRNARDGGLKITVHMMPNLFQNPKDDISMFKELYSDPKYVPDAVKIYPTLVLPNTPLFNMWKKKEYVPYDSDKVVEVIASIKSITPHFTRIQRVQRDIPAYLIVDGVRYGNLRELAQKKLKEWRKKCHCIRCREVGHQTNQNDLSWIDKEKEYFFFEYPASEGKEHFISYETSDRQTLFGFLRLREPSSHAFMKEALDPPATLIRELHVYGKVVGIGKFPRDLDWQHRGIGQRMISFAEEISIDKGYQKILVTSGLGVRDYYRKLGFHQDGPYLSKMLK